MIRARLAALAVAVLFLRWLATGEVAVTVGGLTAAVPALAVAALALVVVTAAAAVLIVYRTRAEQAMLAAWRAQHAARRVRPVRRPGVA